MVKMSDIAARLGVSRLTVSAVLNDREAEVGISADTARRVRETAEEMGYHRNQLAIAIKTGKNPVVGCLISDLKAEWASRTLSGLLRGLHEGGYLVKIEEVSGPKAENAALTRFTEQRVAGIFCCNFNPGDAFLRRLEQVSRSNGIPVVCSLSRKDIQGTWVDSDDRYGMKLATTHLWELGHRRICYLAGSRNELLRGEGFREAMQGYGLEVSPKNFVFTDWNFARAETITERFLSGVRTRPSAIICESDTLACAVVRRARRLGITVPEDLSVVGFSDSHLCEFFDPPLTSVRQPFEEIGMRCGTLLIEQIQSNKASRARKGVERLATNLVIRSSTAPARGL